MKLNSPAVLVGIVLLVMVFGAPGAVQAQPPPRSFHLALGDSVAVGTGALEPHLSGYVGLFHHDIRVNQGEDQWFANLAVNGETSRSFISGGQLEAALAAINDPAYHVEGVTLTIGANDLLALLGREPCASRPAGGACQLEIWRALATVAANYPIILGALDDALNGNSGPGRIMVMTYYNPFSGTGHPLEAPVEVITAGLNGIIWVSSTEFGATAVDVYPLFHGRALDLTHIAHGDIHPNNDGHAVIAGAFVAAGRGR